MALSGWVFTWLLTLALSLCYQCFDNLENSVFVLLCVINCVFVQLVLKKSHLRLGMSRDVFVYIKCLCIQ